MKLKIFLLVLYFFSLQKIQGAERAESFIIKIFDDKVKVLAPKSKRQDVAVIIENNSLSHIYARLQGREHHYDYISLDSQKSRAIQLDKIIENDELTFMAISPAFQEVPLKFNVEAYEIPPQT